MAPIISVNSIGKKYRLNGLSYANDTLRDAFASMFSLQRTSPGGGHREFWALKDVSFEVNEGEVVGIVGRNGAGKSTLLKILSRITTPTTGEAILNGRVGSLLEVGTGFHPELTGRENVYFNGTILGLRKHEIKARFDEIVAFSGIEAFIDTPIKRYSSGMKMRLAFSVAAHLEPEIMIIDEVLAVGDADFQSKCLGKMREVSASGRTIIFVSHNLNSVQQLCSRVLFMQDGYIAADSTDVSAVITNYLRKDNSSRNSEWVNEGDLEFAELRIDRLRLVDAQGERLSRQVGSDEMLAVELQCDVRTSDPNLAIGYALYDQAGSLIYYSYHTDWYGAEKLAPGRTVLRGPIPPNILNDGQYTVQAIAGVMHRHTLLSRENSHVEIKVDVAGSPLRSSLWIGARSSAIAPAIKWESNCG